MVNYFKNTLKNHQRVLMPNLRNRSDTPSLCPNSFLSHEWISVVVVVFGVVSFLLRLLRLLFFSFVAGGSTCNCVHGCKEKTWAVYLWPPPSQAQDRRSSLRFQHDLLKILVRRSPSLSLAQC